MIYIQKYVFYADIFSLTVYLRTLNLPLCLQWAQPFINLYQKVIVRLTPLSWERDIGCGRMLLFNNSWRGFLDLKKLSPPTVQSLYIDKLMCEQFGQSGILWIPLPQKETITFRPWILSVQIKSDFSPCTAGTVLFAILYTLNSWNLGRYTFLGAYNCVIMGLCYNVFPNFS